LDIRDRRWLLVGILVLWYKTLKRRLYGGLGPTSVAPP
jgi:hypothetical protein